MAITVDVVAVSWDCWSIWCLVVSGVLVCGGAWCPVGTEEVRVRVSVDACVGVRRPDSRYWGKDTRI